MIGVRPLGSQRFGVTLGPGPHLFWYVTSKPPKLGEMVVVTSAEATRLRLRDGSSIIQLSGGTRAIEPDAYARRVVDGRWVKRVRQMVRRPLFGYQAEGAAWLAERLARRRGSILADDMGLGKTSQVLAALAATRATPAIIVCPSSVKHNWFREVALLAPRLRATIVDGSHGSIGAAHFVIINYDLLRKRARQLAALRARAIIFDEAHLLKEPQPTPKHRASVATRLAHFIRTAVLLTGTPLLNRPEELWRLLHIVDPYTWHSFDAYRERYCTNPTKEEKDVKAVITGHGQAKRLDELRALTAPYMLRRLRAGALRGQLPPKQRRTVRVELHPFDRKNYDQAEKDVLKWLKGVVSTDRVESAKRGQSVVKLNMLRRIAAVGKLRREIGQYLQAWFDNENRPLIIFAFHRQVLRGTHKICRSLGLRISSISGCDSSEERQRAVDVFQSGRSQVFIAPIKSAGVGLNSTAR